MPTRFQAAGDTLSRMGVLQWSRLSAHRHPDLGHLQVRYLGWWFAEPSGAKLQLIEDAVRTTSTEVDWRVDTSRRNWLLAPALILGDGADPAASHAFDERVEAATEDQVWCAHAWDDLDAIVRTLGGLVTPGENAHGG